VTISRKLVLTLLFSLGSIAPAFAQDWPAKEPIKVIVPFTPASATDIVARAVFTQVSHQINQSVVVENRGGGGTTIGSAAVAKAEPDGYTLLVNSTSHVVVASTFAHLPYDVASDFLALSGLAVQPFVVTSRTKYKTLSDLVAFGRANPGALNYGSIGVGTAGMLFMEKLALAAKFKMTNVSFRGTAEGLTEMMGDRLDLFPAPVPAMIEYAKAGKVNALAVSTAQPSRYLPGVPGMDAAGYAEAAYNFWIGAFAPAKTPPAVAARIHDEIIKALNSAEVQKEITNLGADTMPMSMADFDAFIRKEIKTNAEVVAAAGIKPQ